MSTINWLIVVLMVICVPAFGQSDTAKKQKTKNAETKTSRPVKTQRLKESRSGDSSQRQESRVKNTRGSIRGQMPADIAERFNSKDISELVELVKIWRMSRELELSQQQTLKILDMNDDQRKKIVQLRQQQQRLIGELRKAVQNKSGKKSISGLTKKIAAIDEEKLQAELDQQKQLLEGMTPQQKAKYYIFRNQFNQDVRGIINQILKRRRAANNDSARSGDNPHDGPATSSRR